MSRKRALLSDVLDSKKRYSPAKTATADVEWPSEDIVPDGVALPSDTEAALLYLKNLFPLDKFEGRLPPIIVRNQLYSIVKNRTIADKELEDLRQNGRVRLFKLASEAGQLCVVFTEDYRCHVQRFATTLNQAILDKFLSIITGDCHDISLSKDTLIGKHHFKDEDITRLVNASVLTVRDVNSWWLAIPDAGVFMKSYVRGRKAVITIISKSKYREILQPELEARKLPKIARLGMMYHIHDIIGSDLVTCVSTTSGPILRLHDSS